MDSIVIEPDAEMQVSAMETRFSREARVAKDFGALLHDVTTKAIDDIDRTFVASARKDRIREAFSAVITDMLELDESLDLFDLQNLLHQGRICG
jgi:hypothetical protein